MEDVKERKITATVDVDSRDFTWAELVTILAYFGFEELKKGKTGGSRRKFADAKKRIITLHKPHPGNIIKGYAIHQVIEYLIDNGFIQK